MKYKGQGRKNYVVVQFSDYLNDWEVIGEPVTAKRAIWHVLDQPKLHRDFVHIEMWNQGFRPCLPSKGYETKLPKMECI